MISRKHNTTQTPNKSGCISFGKDKTKMSSLPLRVANALLIYITYVLCTYEVVCQQPEFSVSQLQFSGNTSCGLIKSDRWSWTGNVTMGVNEFEWIPGQGRVNITYSDENELRTVCQIDIMKCKGAEEGTCSCSSSEPDSSNGLQRTTYILVVRNKPVKPQHSKRDMYVVISSKEGTVLKAIGTFPKVHSFSSCKPEFVFGDTLPSTVEDGSMWFLRGYVGKVTSDCKNYQQNSLEIKALQTTLCIINLGHCKNRRSRIGDACFCSRQEDIMNTPLTNLRINIKKQADVELSGANMSAVFQHVSSCFKPLVVPIEFPKYPTVYPSVEVTLKVNKGDSTTITPGNTTANNPVIMLSSTQARTPGNMPDNNELVNTPTSSPGNTPDIIPAITPGNTPGNNELVNTPASTPGNTPGNTPAVIPGSMTRNISPRNTPGSTPQNIKGITPGITPVKTPRIKLGNALEASAANTTGTPLENQPEAKQDGDTDGGAMEYIWIIGISVGCLVGIVSASIGTVAVLNLMERNQNDENAQQTLPPQVDFPQEGNQPQKETPNKDAGIPLELTTSQPDNPERPSTRNNIDSNKSMSLMQEAQTSAQKIPQDG